MKRALGILALVLVSFVALALGLDAVIGATQPALEPEGREGVLRTFGADGSAHETRLVVIDDGGTLWIQSGHHFRGWYHRLLESPDVELVREGETTTYHAVAVDTPAAEAHVKGLLRKRAGAVRFALIRTLLLFADVKPVRLDPR